MVAISTYPIEGAPLVRGDPVAIQVDIEDDDGVPQDVSDWVWRAHIRRSADAKLLDQFDIEVIAGPDGIIPSRVLLRLPPERSRNLRTGLVFDLEQLDNAATPSEPIRTWWICTRLRVVKDVSHQ